MQPYNYRIDAQTPLESTVQGLQLGSMLSDIRNRNEMSNISMQKNKLVNDILSKKQLSAKDMIDLSMVLPDENKKLLNDQWNALTKERQENELKFAGKVMSSINSGAFNVSKDLLSQRAKVERDAGNNDMASGYETYAKMIDINPNAAQAIIGSMVSSLPNGEKIIDASLRSRKEPLELSDIESKILEREQRLALDQDKFTTDVGLKQFELKNEFKKQDSAIKKDVNNLIIESNKSLNTAQNANDLAIKIKNLGGGAGVASSANEWFKKVSGNPDEWTMLRDEYTRIRGKIATSTLPPGPASDKDIMIAMQGLPDKNIRAEDLSQFLLGFSKLKYYESWLSGAQGEWIDENGTLGKAKRDIVVDGQEVPQGTSFNNFVKTHESFKTNEKITTPKSNTKTYARFLSE